MPDARRSCHEKVNGLLLAKTLAYQMYQKVVVK